MDFLYQFHTKLDQFDKMLHRFDQQVDGWIKENWRRAIIPIQLAIGLEVLLLALMLEIVKLGGAAVPPALVYKLSVELMIEILLSALGGTGRSPKDLLRLASVCKYWRNVILSNSCFWTVIDTHHRPHSCTLVLKRDRVRPLDVHFRGRDGRRYNTNIISHVVRLLAPESRRIRSLNFEVKPGAPYFQSFFETTSLPSLTHLTVSVIPQTAVPVFIHLDCGPLRYLSLENAAIRWDTALLYDLETLSLSKLNQDPPTIAQLHHILSSTPFLRELSLIGWNARLMPGYWTIPQISPVTLPLLTELEVEYLPEVIDPCLIAMLDLPSLRDVIWRTTSRRTVQSGPGLLRLSAQCIKASPELVIRGSRWSWTLSITSKKWTSTPIRQDAEPCKSVDLSISSRSTFRLIKQFAALLDSSNSVLFETDSKNSAKRARKFFLRSGAFFTFNIYPILQEIHSS